jgi:hypothetical protein
MTLGGPAPRAANRKFRLYVLAGDSSGSLTPLGALPPDSFPRRNGRQGQEMVAQARCQALLY